jgi:hypothetical protein
MAQPYAQPHIRPIPGGLAHAQVRQVRMPNWQLRAAAGISLCHHVKNAPVTVRSSLMQGCSARERKFHSNLKNRMANTRLREGKRNEDGDEQSSARSCAVRPPNRPPHMTHLTLLSRQSIGGTNL